MLRTPRTDPSEPDSGTGLLPWMSDGKAGIGPRMKETRGGEPVLGQAGKPVPREAVLLTATPERLQPEAPYVVPKRPQASEVGGHGVVPKVATDDLPQPPSLVRNRIVHACSQRFLDGLELGPHAIAAGLAYQQEASL